MPPAKKRLLSRGFRPEKKIKVKVFNLTTKTTGYKRISLYPSPSTSSSSVTRSMLQYAPEPVDLSTDNNVQAKKRTYLDKKIDEYHRWEKCRDKFLTSAISRSSLPLSAQCTKCGKEDAEQYLRCLDCCSKSLWCEQCLIDLHPVQRLHKINIYKNGLFYPGHSPHLTTLMVSSNAHLCANVTLIDSKGRTHDNCSFYYETDLAQDLIHMGYWPLTPHSPSMAISEELLKLMHSLTLVCHVSVQGFVQAVNDYNCETMQKSMLHRISRGECISEFRLYFEKLKAVPFSLSGDEKWQRDCPACTANDGPLFMSMDANFGLVHKMNAGWAYGGSPIDHLFFEDQITVNNFVDNYYLDSKQANEDCSNFQAADVLRSKNKSVRLDVKGVFGSACRHEIPMKFCDLLHGERLSYPVHMIERVKECYPQSQLKVLYDIACVLRNHLKKRGKTELLQCMELAIPIFHSYGHKAECQVMLNPRKIKGFGLTDGEQLERLWSYLRPFGRITKEQTPVHRKSLLNMALLHYATKKKSQLEHSLDQKYTKAEQTLSVARQKLDEAFSTYLGVISDKDKGLYIVSMDREEKALVKSGTPHSQKSDWKSSYGRELCSYYSLKEKIEASPISLHDSDSLLADVASMERSDAKLRSIEKQKAIQRWVKESHMYKSVVAKIQLDKGKRVLLKLRNLSIEMEFLRESNRRYSDGQAIATRITTKLKDVSKKIDNAISVYNSSASMPHEHIPSKVERQDIHTSSPIFFSLSNDASDESQRTTPVSVRHAILDNFNLTERAEEEMNLIKLEMANTYSYYQTKLLQLREASSGLQNAIDDYHRGLNLIIVRQIFLLEMRLKNMRYIFHKRGVTVANISFTIEHPKDIYDMFVQQDTDIINEGQITPGDFFENESPSSHTEELEEIANSNFDLDL